jgi:DNA polymerase I
MRAAMAEASRLVLAGFELGTDVKTVCWPDRYADPRGIEMWSRVSNLVDVAEKPRRQWAMGA